MTENQAKYGKVAILTFYAVIIAIALIAAINSAAVS